MKTLITLSKFIVIKAKLYNIYLLHKILIYLNILKRFHVNYICYLNSLFKMFFFSRWKVYFKKKIHHFQNYEDYCNFH